MLRPLVPELDDHFLYGTEFAGLQTRCGFLRRGGPKRGVIHHQLDAGHTGQARHFARLGARGRHGLLGEVMDVPPGTRAEDGEVKTVGRGHNDGIRFHLVQHLLVITEELDAGGNPGLGLIDQLRMRVGNPHQLRVRTLQHGGQPAPHVIVVKPHDGYASLRRLGKSHACRQAQKKNEQY